MCARGISCLWNFFLESNILSPVPFVDFTGNNPLLKASGTNSLPS